MHVGLQLLDDSETSLDLPGAEKLMPNPHSMMIICEGYVFRGVTKSPARNPFSARSDGHNSEVENVPESLLVVQSQLVESIMQQLTTCLHEK